MLRKIRSLGVQGIAGYEVTAECDLAGGLPNFDIVGLGDTAVKEARERVRSAIKNSGFSFPVGRITVNLAPANLRKSGTVYDLPILVGILSAGEQIPWSDPDCAFVGELSLSGTLRPVVGMLPMALAAREAGIQRLYVPADSAPEATLAEGLTVYPVETVVKHAPPDPVILTGNQSDVGRKHAGGDDKRPGMLPVLRREPVMQMRQHRLQHRLHPRYQVVLGLMAMPLSRAALSVLLSATPATSSTSPFFTAPGAVRLGM